MSEAIQRNVIAVWLGAIFLFLVIYYMESLNLKVTQASLYYGKVFGEINLLFYVTFKVDNSVTVTVSLKGLFVLARTSRIGYLG